MGTSFGLISAAWGAPIVNILDMNITTENENGTNREGNISEFAK